MMCNRVDFSDVEIASEGFALATRLGMILSVSVILVLGQTHCEAQVTLPVNPPPIIASKPPVLGTNTPHTIDRAKVSDKDEKLPKAEVEKLPELKDPGLNAELLNELRAKDPTPAEVLPEASKLLIDKIKKLADDQINLYNDLYSKSPSSYVEETKIHKQLTKIDFFSLKPSSISIKGDKPCVVLTCPEIPSIGFRFGNLVGATHRDNPQPIAILAVQDDKSHELRVFNAESMLDKALDNLVAELPDAQGSLKTVTIERLDVNNEYEPSTLNYWFNGTIKRLFAPHPEHHKLPPNGIGLIVFHKTSIEDAVAKPEPIAKLVRAGHYAFQHDVKKSEWKIVHKTYRVTIDNSQRPAAFHFAFVGSSEPLVVPPLEMATFAVLQPDPMITYRRDTSTSLDPIKMTLAPGHWEVISDPSKDEVKLNFAPNRRTKPLDIEKTEMVILRNSEESKDRVQFYTIEPNEKTSEIKLIPRILDPGEASYAVAYPMKAGTVTKRQQVVVFEELEPGKPSPPYALLDPGYYEFVKLNAETKLNTTPLLFSVSVSNPKTNSFQFRERQDPQASVNRTLNMNSLELKRDRPITVEFDPGDGQGLVRQPLPSIANSRAPAPTNTTSAASYVVELDPRTQLLRLRVEK